MTITKQMEAQAKKIDSISDSKTKKPKKSKRKDQMQETLQTMLMLELGKKMAGVEVGPQGSQRQAT